MKLTSIITAVLLLSATATQAMTGNVLLLRINGTDNAYTNALGYVQGVGDVLGNLDVYCPPNHTTVGQHTEVVGRWLSVHRDRLMEPADELIGKALSTEWPCKRRNML